MDVTRIQHSLKDSVNATERVFESLAQLFPKILSVKTQQGENSISSAKELFFKIEEGFSNLQTDNSSFFTEINKNNKALLDTLTQKLEGLESINERVTEIREDSEELEIISLNAMIISIKSGEKGRAFSRITENLKKLSAQMILITNNLILEEKALFEKSTKLQNNISLMMNTSTHEQTEEMDSVNQLIFSTLQKASTLLDQLNDKALSIMTPIRTAMTGIQLQDIIKQSSDQIVIVLKDVIPIPARYGQEPVQDKKLLLDQLTLNIELLTLCKGIILDVLTHLDTSLLTFTDSWSLVNEILLSVEALRNDFKRTYLSNSLNSSFSLQDLLDKINTSFSSTMKSISVYQQHQKTLISDASNIIYEVKNLSNLFDMIRPIMSRLQHVRITQQIEVAKNAAISAVKDTVEHMSQLIIQSNERIQLTKEELETLIDSIESTASKFFQVIEKSHTNLNILKQEKSLLFNSMNHLQQQLYDTINSLEIFPASFSSLCTQVDTHIHDLQAISKQYTHYKEIIEKEQDSYVQMQKKLLEEMNISSWSIQNDKLRNLVKQFTITNHKEIAGEIGNFEVEKNSFEHIETGDVTLF